MLNPTSPSKFTIFALISWLVIKVATIELDFDALALEKQHSICDPQNIMMDISRFLLNLIYKIKHYKLEDG
jgi:hypothetical protein